MLCACGLIVVALLYFQIYQSDVLLLCSKKNILRYEEVDSLRGAILDCKGRPLATNRPITQLIWQGTCNRKFTDNQQAILQNLEAILKVPLANNTELLTCEQLGRACVLCEDVPLDALCNIMEQCIPGSNIIIKTDHARFYPHKKLACHVIGYFRDAPGANMGLENLFEEQLKGNPGTIENMVNALGQPQVCRELVQAQAGQAIQTTLNLDLQMLAEALFPAGMAGACIVMDPETGDIQALLSRPDFDPNIFTKPIDPAEWQKMVEQKPFINRALLPQPPASLFKIITTSAALDEGIITPQTSWYCTGKINYGGRDYHCHHIDYGHGHVASIEDAIAYSCDIPFYDIGKHILIGKLAAYAHKFGLGEPTGIMFPEKIGIVPTDTWKRKVFKEPWWQGETVQAAIGQTYLLVTPMQMARVIGSIGTGFLVKPRVLQQEPIKKTPLDISLATRETVKRGLYAAIDHGTAQRLKRVPKDLDIFAKTGTAQTSNLSKKDMGFEYVDHAWLACWAQYKDHSPVVLVLFIEHAGSSSVAVHVAQDFFKYYCAYLDTGILPAFPINIPTPPLPDGTTGATLPIGTTPATQATPPGVVQGTPQPALTKTPALTGTNPIPAGPGELMLPTIQIPELPGTKTLLTEVFQK
jgi:penicillin-binding protein 2